MTTTATATNGKVNTRKASDVPIVDVSDSTIKNLTTVFNMMADEVRLKILLALAKNGETNVSALCEMLGKSQPAVSHHLTLMRMTNVVAFNRVGKNNCYYLNSPFLQSLLEEFFDEVDSEKKQLRLEDFTLTFKKR